jgi:hypothetical protein
MISSEERTKTRETWSKHFENLKRYGVPYEFTLRQLAGLYAVASICYDDGNHSPLIADELFDRLCKWLYEHYDECVAQGADMLDRDLLRCCSGHDTRIFVKPYHEIAEAFLGHACQCLKCRLESNAETETDPPSAIDHDSREIETGRNHKLTTTVAKLEKTVWDQDRVRIVVRDRSATMVAAYPHSEAAQGDWSVSQFLKDRISPLIRCREVTVVEGNGRIASGRKHLKTIRESYN